MAKAAKDEAQSIAESNASKAHPPTDQKIIVTRGTKIPGGVQFSSEKYNVTVIRTIAGDAYRPDHVGFIEKELDKTIADWRKKMEANQQANQQSPQVPPQAPPINQPPTDFEKLPWKFYKGNQDGAGWIFDHEGIGLLKQLEATKDGTLTKDKWTYLLKKAKDGSDLRFIQRKPAKK